MNSAFQYTDSRKVSRLMADRADPHLILAEEIGPAYSEYRRQWDAARTFQQQPPFPLHVDYEMKFRCNLRCPMCLMSLPAERRSRYGQMDRELPPATVKSLIDYGAERGQRALGFGGLWEPLLSAELPEIVAHARKRGLVDVMFNTNGLLLTRETGRALIEAGLTRIMISLDAATAETYAKMRAGSDFETVTANIENFAALKKQMGRRLPLLRLSFCRTAVNEHELEDFLERWRDTADFFSIQNYGRYESADPPGPAQSRPQPEPPGRCAQPHKRLMIRHNGDVLPCCDASGLPLKVGNIYEQDLESIWQGSCLAELRERLSKTDFSGPAEICRACQTKF